MNTPFERTRDEWVIKQRQRSLLCKPEYPDRKVVVSLLPKKYLKIGIVFTSIVYIFVFLNLPLLILGSLALFGNFGAIILLVIIIFLAILRIIKYTNLGRKIRKIILRPFIPSWDKFYTSKNTIKRKAYLNPIEQSDEFNQIKKQFETKIQNSIIANENFFLMLMIFANIFSHFPILEF